MLTLDDWPTVQRINIKKPVKSRPNKKTHFPKIKNVIYNFFFFV